MELVEHFVILHTYIAVIRTGSKQGRGLRLFGQMFLSALSVSLWYERLHLREAGFKGSGTHGAAHKKACREMI